jgi:EAL domain-containing protein (putative c-di-GMP-specific phosphodiesterase class I)
MTTSKTIPATSIIALAQNLLLAVIAEGVETARQLDYLRHHSCDEMQGYYFSRPLPAMNSSASANVKKSGSDPFVVRPNRR